MNSYRRFAAHLSLAAVVAMMAALAFLTPGPASASPSVTTDKEDYAPSETVIVTGTGYGPGDMLDIVITRPDSTILTGDGTDTGGWDTIFTEPDGTFTYNYILNGILGSYTIDVYPSPWNGLESFDIPIASTTFTDYTTATLSINSAAYSTNSLTVGLLISWSGSGSDPTQVRLGNDTSPEGDCGSGVTYGAWQAKVEIGTSNTMSVSPWTLLTDAATNPDSGLKRVCVQLAQGAVIGTPSGTQVTANDLIYYRVPNPALGQSCGLDIALVIDSSGSIDSGEMTQMKNAMLSFVSSFLPATPTQMAVVEFDTQASVTQGFTNNTTLLNTAINAAASGGSTNWDDALRDARTIFPNRAANPDLIVFASDGNPNYRGGHTDLEHSSGTSSVTEQNAMSWASAEANAARAAGVRIISLGIGSDLDNNNMIVVSGPNSHPPDPISTTTDLISSDFSTLATDLSNLAKQLCGGTITVQKILDTDGNIGTTGDQSPGVGWTYTTNVDAPDTSTPVSGVTDGSGMKNFAINVGVDLAANVDVTETLQGGYTFVSANCVKQGNIAVGTPASLVVNNIPVNSQDIITCKFYNTAITTADVKITSQNVTIPPSANVGSSFTIAVNKTLHNNGPATPINVSINPVISGPPDCTITAAGGNPTSATLATSVANPVTENFNVSCTQPSTHQFTVNNCIAITTSGMTDPNSSNNCAAQTQVSTNILGTSDLKVASVVMSSPASTAINAPFTVSASAGLHNNGTSGATNADSIHTLNLPPDCTTSSPNPQTVQNSALAVSVVSNVGPSWSVTCTNPSTHSFTTTTTVVVDQNHVTDPTSGNNTGTSSPRTTNLLGTADVKVSGVTATAPGSAAVGAPFTVTGSAVIHNNGPYGPTSVDTTITLTLPSDCTTSSTNPVVLNNTSLPVSTPTTVPGAPASWSVTCTSPSNHTFTVGATSLVDELHVTDPNSSNNTVTKNAVNIVTATSDVKVTSVSVSSPPSASAGSAFSVTASAVLHNNGGYGPTNVDSTLTLTLPGDCTTGSANPVTVNNTSLPVSTPTTVPGAPASWSVTCTSPSAHNFSVAASTVVDQLHVSDTTTSNNTRTNSSSTNVLSTSDVKVTSVSVSSPASANAGSPFNVTSQAVVHNNGGYGPTNADTNFTLTLPGDCTTSSANPQTANDTSLATSTPTTVGAPVSWSVTCTSPSAHNFSVGASVSVDQLHVSDATPGNNSGNNSSNTNILASSDIKVTGVAVSSPGSANVNSSFAVTGQATVHNNGGYGPTNVDTTLTLSVPADCTITGTNPVVVQNTSLATSAATSIPAAPSAWSVTCTTPSAHSLSVSASAVVDQLHVSDPTSGNNSSSNSSTTNILSTADAKVSSVAVSAPLTANIGVPFNVVVTTVLHNNGPQTPTNVDSVIGLAVPPDCTRSPAGSQTQADTALVQSTPVTVIKTWSVTCSSQSSHVFNGSATTTLDQLHVSDPNTGNNGGNGTATTSVYGDAELKVTSSGIVAPGTFIPGVPFTVTVNTALHNNGPITPANADFNVNLTIPGDCTKLPNSAQSANDLSLALSTTNNQSQSWTVTCTDPVSQSFSSTSSITLDMIHVNDPNGANNTGATTPVAVSPAAGSITIVKDAIPNDPQDFSFTCSAPLGSFALDDDANGTLSNTNGPVSVSTGTYSCSEAGVSGWVQTSATCSDGSPVSAIAVAPAENVTCTFTNTKNGSITIIKDAVPNDPQDFSFTCSAPLGNFSLDDDADGTLSNTNGPVSVAPGTYNCSEAAVSGWVQTSATCSDSSPVNAISVSPGENVTCTFTNTKNGSVTIIKDAVPNDPQDFSFTCAAPVGNFALDDDADGTLSNTNGPVSVSPGTYNCSEAAVSGWVQTSATCSDSSPVNAISVSPGENVTCTFTNTKNGSITIIKDAVPNDPQDFSFTCSAPLGNFSLDDDADGTLSNTNGPVSVSPGTYNCSEAAVSGWVQTSATCSDSSPVNAISVSPGENVTCTFTNTKNSYITIIKDAVPNDPQDFSFTCSAPLGNFSLDDDADGTLSNTNGPVSVSPGTYNCSEAAVSGWTQTSATCSDGSPVNAISVSQGENVTCTFTNTKNGSITIIKDAVPNDPQDFSFACSAPLGNFSLDDDADGTLSNTNGPVSVSPGTYNCSEAAVSGWTQTSATCSDSSPVNAISVSPGEIVTCTFANTKGSTITIVKDAVPNDAQDFSFTCSAPLGNFSLDDDADGTLSNTNGPVSVAPGTYNCSEAAVSGWVQTSATCSDSSPVNAISVSPGENVTCTFTNTKNGSITIIKDAVPNDPQDFSFTCSAPLGNFSLDDDADGTLSNTNGPVSVSPGTFNCSEAAVSGWVQTSATCSDSSPVNAISVSPGENVTCTFTNTKNGSVTIIKDAVPNDPQDFSFTCSAPLGNFSLDDDADGTLSNTNGPVSVAPGTYNCSEAAVSGWVQTSATCSDSSPVNAISVSPGENVTCTFTNTKNGSITIIKDAVPNDPQDFSFTCSAPLGNFSLDDDADGTLSNTNGPVSVSPGTFNCSEAAVSGWVQTSATCSDSSPVNAISVSPGENVTCTFTNTKNGSITIIKDAVPNDPQDFSFTCAAPVGNFALDDDADGTLSNTNGPVSVAPGTYNCSEAAVSGWVQTSATCSDGSPVSAINVAAGENVTCTFTNTKDSQLTIVKDATPNDAQDFSFTCAAPVGNFALDDDADGTLSNTQGPVVIPPGTYSCSETPVSGWTQTSATCSDGSPVNAISLAPGEMVTCTFNNAKNGTITIVKDAIPNDAQDFSFTCSAPLGTFPLDDDADGTLSNTKGPVTVAAGSYSCSEAAASGWIQTSATCSDGSPVNAISVALGENVTCTFTNTKVSSITIIKDAAPNDPQDFSFGGTCFAPFSLDDDADGTLTNTKASTLAPGACTVVENASPAGWGFTSLVCSDPDGGTTTGGQTANIDLDVGEAISCTYTNTKNGTLVIVKDTIPNLALDFNFVCSTLGAFQLDDDADGTLPNTKQFNDVVPGTYTCTETSVPGYAITISCADPDSGSLDSPPSATIDLDPGETVTCTYFNVGSPPGGPNPVGGIAGLLDVGQSPQQAGSTSTTGSLLGFLGALLGSVAIVTAAGVVIRRSMR